MELSTIIGLVCALIAVFGTATIKHLPLSSLWGASALCVVGVGSISAVMLAYPLKDVIHSLKSLAMCFKGPGVHPEGLISDVERLAQVARKDGFLALEKEVDKIDDPFLQKGIRMLVDNTDPAVIQDVLDAEIAMLYEEEEIAGRFWEDVGAFSPTVGIIGAVLGLMYVMQNLQDQSKIGPGIATAFIATIYGVALANLWALPLGKKIKRMCHHKKMFREMASIGVMGIANSVNPRVLVERLQGMAH